MTTINQRMKAECGPQYLIIHEDGREIGRYDTFAECIEVLREHYDAERDHYSVRVHDIWYVSRHLRRKAA